MASITDHAIAEKIAGRTGDARRAVTASAIATATSLRLPRDVAARTFATAALAAFAEAAWIAQRNADARTPRIAALLFVTALAPAALYALPITAARALPLFRLRRARIAAAAWCAACAAALVATCAPLLPYLQRLADDYGRTRVAPVALGGLSALVTPALACIAPPRSARARGAIAAAFGAAIAFAALDLGRFTFVRLDPRLQLVCALIAVHGAGIVRGGLGLAARPRAFAPLLAAAIALVVPWILPLPADLRAVASNRGVVVSSAIGAIAPPLPELPRWRPAPPPPPEAPRPLARPPRLVLLVTVDALRWDAFHDAELPTFARLRAESVELARARTVAGYTLGALYGLMTARGPWRIDRWIPARIEGDRAVPAPRGRPAPLLDRSPTLAAALGGARYATRACGVMSAQVPGMGLTGGFDAVDLAIFHERNPDDRGTTADRITACALRQIDAAGASPLFLWVHYFDPHGPYTAHAETPPKADSPQGRYRSEVAFVDLHLGRLLDAIEARIARDDTLVVFTADHGEELEDHGADAHVLTLYDETIRVPALVRAPGVAPRVIEDDVSIVDLAPTVLDLAGAPPLRDVDGRSLAGALRGEPLAPRPVFAETQRMDRSLRAVVMGRDKLVYDGRFGLYELFDLDADPLELHPRRGAPDRARELAAVMRVPPPRPAALARPPR